MQVLCKRLRLELGQCRVVLVRIGVVIRWRMMWMCAIESLIAGGIFDVVRVRHSREAIAPCAGMLQRHMKRQREESDGSYERRKLHDCQV